MKRTLYRNLIRTARQRTPDHEHEITATWTWRPGDVPVWAPQGRGWVELEAASLWARRAGAGIDVLVLTSTLDENGRYRDDRALILGHLADDGLGLGSVADKPHKIYTWAEKGTTEPYVVFGQHDAAIHPAEVYWRYMESVRETFERTVRAAPNPYEFDLWYFAVERHPNGSILLSFENTLSQYRTAPDPDDGVKWFWWDAARYADLVATVCATYGPRVRLAADTSCRDVGDPLWKAGVAELWPKRRK